MRVFDNTHQLNSKNKYILQHLNASSMSKGATLNHLKSISI